MPRSITSVSEFKDTQLWDNNLGNNFGKQLNDKYNLENNYFISKKDIKYYNTIYIKIQVLFLYLVGYYIILIEVLFIHSDKTIQQKCLY